VVAAYAFLVWLLAGLLTQGWWGQLMLLGVAVYLMIELSNSNALMRVRSRMVSCVFLTLSCTSVAWFSSYTCGLLALCLVAALYILFHAYQNTSAAGPVYYAFLLLGIATIAFVPLLYFIPLFWVLMTSQLQLMSWRTWLASLFGLLTPYWLCIPWLLFRQEGALIAAHFKGFGHLEHPFDWSVVSACQIVTLLFVVALLALAMVHFWHYSFEEKIRNRQIFGFFFYVSVFALLFLIVQPQHYYQLLRIVLVSSSPLVAHFFVHTHTKATNILFWSATAFSLLLTISQLFFSQYQCIFDAML